MHELNTAPAQLCDHCKHLTFWSPGFTLEDKASVFKAKSTDCKFCLAIWGLCLRSNTPEASRIIIRRDQSSLKMTDEFENRPVLSLVRSPGTSEIMILFESATKVAGDRMNPNPRKTSILGCFRLDSLSFRYQIQQQQARPMPRGCSSKLSGHGWKIVTPTMAVAIKQGPGSPRDSFK